MYEHNKHSTTKIIKWEELYYEMVKKGTKDKVVDYFWYYATRFGCNKSNVFQLQSNKKNNFILIWYLLTAYAIVYSICWFSTSVLR